MSILTWIQLVDAAALAVEAMIWRSQGVEPHYWGA